MSPKTVSAVPANFFMLLDTYLSGRYFVAFGQIKRCYIAKLSIKLHLNLSVSPQH